ncbi:hypothetical protein D3C84_879810 [compost metagenome]
MLGEITQRQGVDSQAFGRLNQAAVEARGLQFVTRQIAAAEITRGRPKHGLRAGQVQQAHLRVSEEDDQARCFGLDFAGGG